jgi:hypothetical protein
MRLKVNALVVLAALLLSATAFAKITIVCPHGASSLETLASHEVRRYFYLRTGQLLPIISSDELPEGDSIVVARKDRPLAGRFAKSNLDAEQYVLRTEGHTLFLVGGNDTGTLYAAYRFAERLGVRFYLHGDVIPDRQIAPALPSLDETGRPLFSIRGIQPFHDFSEGPDWWNQDDYLAYIAQLPKLRMNFLGLHNYPESNVGPEPGVWIGQPGDLAPGGEVRFSYPSQWANTERDGMWGYAPMKTSEFCCGAGRLFEKDVYGPRVMDGMMPAPRTPGQSNQLFDNAGALFRVAFREAKAIGVKTCIGTETPLTIPKLVQERLRSEGKDPKAPAVIRGIYEAMFRRIQAAYPVDYYWLWTPENWTWGGNKPGEFQATVQDIQAALDALTAIGKPFTLATSGWVLGPQNDRAALDKFLPTSSPISTINRQVGHAPDEPGFADISGRPKWVIPWMENDPDLTAPQPWVGRMRYDAADARRLGCTGLLGIHWRTKILAPNVAALAAAGWDQSWVPADFNAKPLVKLPAVLSGDQEHANPLRGRTMPVGEFYVDFARANFGAAAAEPAGRIFAGIDGVKLPEPSTWIRGPGGIKPEAASWPEVQARYHFVDQLAALRGKIRGAGNLERFDYWLNTYRYMASLAEAGCLRGQLDQAMAAIEAEKDPARRHNLAAQALKVRIELARAWEKMIWFQVAAADTPGELGTLANLEQHNRTMLQFLGIHDTALARALGSPLPASVGLSHSYSGPVRITLPTVRTLASQGETLQLPVLVLDERPARSATVYWRPIGEGALHQVEVKHLSRAVYQAVLPAIQTDVEYYVEVETAAGKKLVWPPTAPALNQTVVVRQ